MEPIAKKKIGEQPPNEDKAGTQGTEKANEQAEILQIDTGKSTG